MVAEISHVSEWNCECECESKDTHLLAEHAFQHVECLLVCLQLRSQYFLLLLYRA